jgi:hypothetical protein
MVPEGHTDPSSGLQEIFLLHESAAVRLIARMSISPVFMKKMVL